MNMSISLDKLAPPVAFVVVGSVLLLIGSTGAVPIGSPPLTITVAYAKWLLILIGLILVLAGPWFVWREMKNQTPVSKQEPAGNVATSSGSSQIKPEIHVTSKLGKGVEIGGSYLGNALKVIAGDWVQHADHSWVASGWLYLPREGPCHAITFFKVALRENGTGYVHILDSANPVHSVWFATSTGFRKQENFCWDSDPGIRRTEWWEFTWELSKGNTG